MGADSNDNVLLPFLPQEKEAVFSGCSLSASFQCPPFQWRGNKNLSQRVLYHTQETGPRIRFGVLVLLTARCARLEEMGVLGASG